MSKWVEIWASGPCYFKGLVQNLPGVGPWANKVSEVHKGPAMVLGTFFLSHAPIFISLVHKLGYSKWTWVKW